MKNECKSSGKVVKQTCVETRRLEDSEPGRDEPKRAKDSGDGRRLEVDSTHALEEQE